MKCCLGSWNISIHSTRNSSGHFQSNANCCREPEVLTVANLRPKCSLWSWLDLPFLCYARCVRTRAASSDLETILSTASFRSSTPPQEANRHLKRVGSCYVSDSTSCFRDHNFKGSIFPITAKAIFLWLCRDGVFHAVSSHRPSLSSRPAHCLLTLSSRLLAVVWLLSSQRVITMIWKHFCVCFASNCISEHGDG